MKAVEIRVRDLAGLTDESVGTDLMNKAFGPKGILTDNSAVKGEQQGTRAILSGPKLYCAIRPDTVT
jgi:Protein of unknown function (Hypoth_ymh)